MNRLGFFLTFGATGALILLGLGFWQLQRLDWKQGVLSEIETRIAADPVALPEALESDVDRYLSVMVEGSIQPGEIHVLISQKRIGAGYRVISPLRLASGRRVLLDRGFIRPPEKDAVRALGPVTVTGNLHWPRETDSFTPDPDNAANIWFARDVPAMARLLDTEEVLVVARSETDANVTPLPVDTAGIPNDHLQYAITWFSLAAIWILMTGVFLRRPRRARNAD